MAPPGESADAAAADPDKRRSLPWWRLRTWRRDLDTLARLRDGLQALELEDPAEAAPDGARREPGGSAPDSAPSGQSTGNGTAPDGAAAQNGNAAHNGTAAQNGTAARNGTAGQNGTAAEPKEPEPAPDPAITAVRKTFAHVVQAGDDAVAYFYAWLFLRQPQLRELFPPAMDEQRDRLFRSLARIVESLSTPEEMASYLSQLGRDHRKYGVVPEMYDAVGEALIATLRAFAAAEFTPEAEEAWTQTYAAGSALMIRAAEDSAAVGPASWTAEVVDVDQRGHGIVVVTVAPDNVLPYEAGQHLTLQTERWPHVWRPYSIACRPRDDGLISLHVKAVPGGWVSNALVLHTKPGDDVILGPALGTMTLRHAGKRDLLCVAGGTGLSPIKAVVEQAVRDSAATPRKIFLFYGARRREELYDLRDLWRLADAYHGLQLTPVTSEDPAFDGMQGNVGRVAARYMPHKDCEAYVAGPADMVRETVRVLRRAGTVRERIHYDDALLAARPRVGSGT